MYRNKTSPEFNERGIYQDAMNLYIFSLFSSTRRDIPFLECVLSPIPEIFLHLMYMLHSYGYCAILIIDEIQSHHSLIRLSISPLFCYYESLSLGSRASKSASSKKFCGPASEVHGIISYRESLPTSWGREIAMGNISELYVL